jgi:hypothetical protein
MDAITLLQVLSSGEKNHVVASTRMNERSSRLHTIIQITIESHEKSRKQNENDDSVSNMSISSSCCTVQRSMSILLDRLAIDKRRRADTSTRGVSLLLWILMFINICHMLIFCLFLFLFIFSLLALLQVD